MTIERFISEVMVVSFYTVAGIVVLYVVGKLIGFAICVGWQKGKRLSQKRETIENGKEEKRQETKGTGGQRSA